MAESRRKFDQDFKKLLGSATRAGQPSRPPGLFIAPGLDPLGLASIVHANLWLRDLPRWGWVAGTDGWPGASRLRAWIRRSRATRLGALGAGGLTQPDVPRTAVRIGPSSLPRWYGLRYASLAATTGVSPTAATKQENENDDDHDRTHPLRYPS